MLKIETNRKKGSTSVQLKGETHDIYKELLSAVVTTLDQMELRTAKGAVPLSESVITFGQHLIMLGAKGGKEFNEVSELRRRAIQALDDFFGKAGEK